jgi:hypothetical protein
MNHPVRVLCIHTTKENFDLHCMLLETKHPDVYIEKSERTWKYTLNGKEAVYHLTANEDKILIKYLKGVRFNIIRFEDFYPSLEVKEEALSRVIGSRAGPRELYAYGAMIWPIDKKEEKS